MWSQRPRETKTMLGMKAAEVLCAAGLEPEPLIRLDELSSGSACIWLKKEWTDPEGDDPLRSIKRKPACLLWNDVLAKRYADPNKVLLSATSGNFGVEIGLLAAEAGLTFFAVVPGSIPEYNLRVLTALGINVIRTTEQETCPREYTVFFARGYAHEYHHRLVNLEQYQSWLNPLAHSLTTGPEILDGLDGQVDHVVLSVGSCGTICGIAQRMLLERREVDVVGVQPVPGHGVPGTHLIKGECKWSPENYSPVVVRESAIEEADSVDAYAFTTKLWELGLPAGPSTGMALSRAYRMARQGARGNIVVVSPDNDFKYADLLTERLERYGDEILARYPELGLDRAIDDHLEELRGRGGLDGLLAAVRSAYPSEREGRLFEVSDIEDIVTGRWERAGAEAARP